MTIMEEKLSIPHVAPWVGDQPAEGNRGVGRLFRSVLEGSSGRLRWKFKLFEGDGLRCPPNDLAEAAGATSTVASPYRFWRPAAPGPK